MNDETFTEFRAAVEELLDAARAVETVFNDDADNRIRDREKLTLGDLSYFTRKLTREHEVLLPLSDNFYNKEMSAYLYKVKKLTIQIVEVYRIVGPPGDWGYENPKGNSLQALYTYQNNVCDLAEDIRIEIEEESK